MDTLKFIAIITITFSIVLILFAIFEDKYWKKKVREDEDQKNFNIIGNVEEYKKK